MDEYYTAIYIQLHDDLVIKAAEDFLIDLARVYNKVIKLVSTRVCRFVCRLYHKSLNLKSISN